MEKRRRWFQLLQRTVELAVANDAALVLVEGTAPEPWVRRAAELYRAKTVLVHVDDPGQRDQALVRLADRVFVLRARRGGRVARLVAERLRTDSASVRVAIHDDADDAGAELVARGAIGWWLCDSEAAPPLSDAASDTRFPRQEAEEFAAQLPDLNDGSWLVHCTRGRSGAWDWQSESQWRDEVLLGGDGGQPLEAGEVLERIVRDGWIRGGAQLTGSERVVCFSAVPLAELLSRRVFRSHLGRWDYEPYGIAIRRSRIAALGGQPVVYADSWAAADLPDEHRWRFQAIGTKVDWRSEAEWRVRGSVPLGQIACEDAVLFVADRDWAARLAPLSRWPVVLAEAAVRGR